MSVFSGRDEVKGVPHVHVASPHCPFLNQFPRTLAAQGLEVVNPRFPTKLSTAFVCNVVGSPGLLGRIRGCPGNARETVILGNFRSTQWALPGQPGEMVSSPTNLSFANQAKVPAPGRLPLIRNSSVTHENHYSLFFPRPAPRFDAVHAAQREAQHAQGHHSQ